MSSEETPTILHKNDPKSGPPTPLLKLNNPVNIANIEASILIGVILVKRTNVGKKEKAKDIVSDIKEVKMTKWMSGIPIIKFHLKTKVRLIRHPTTLHN